MASSGSPATGEFPVSHQFLAEALTEVEDAIVMVDDQYRVVYMNPKAIRQYEIGSEPAVGRLLTDLYRYVWLKPGDEQAAMLALERNGRWRGENLHVLPSGKALHVESTVSALRSSTGQQYMMAVIRDMTAQKKAEADLREAEEWQRLAMAGAQMGTWVTDLETGATQWDARCREIYGVGPDEPATVERGFAIMHPDDRAQAATAYTDALEKGPQGIYAYEKRIVWPDGSVHWVATRGSISVDHSHPDHLVRRLTGVVMDVTERKEYEERLLRANQRAALAEAAVRGFVYELDLASGKGERSPGIYQMLGYRPEELGRDAPTWTELIHPDDYTGSVMGEIEKTLAEGSTFSLEYRLRHRDGHYVYVWDQGIVERDAAGKAVRIVGIAADISQRKQFEQSLQDLNDTLEQRVAMRTVELERSNNELDRFAYVASHDLKSPLRAIDNLSLWIAEDSAAVLSPESQSHLAKLRGRVKRLEALLDDLLLYSRAGRRRRPPEWVDTPALVSSVVELLNPPRGMKVTVQDDMPCICCERVPFEVVMRNLVENAIKHHHEPASGAVAISARQQGDWVEFCVQDDGPGIDPEYHERIFEVFQTLRPRDELEGSGMGLAIVRKSVDSLGGRVWVESAAGKGAAFHFLWPLVTKP